MEPGLLLLLLLTAPWGQGWATSRHASGEMARTDRTDRPSVQPGEPGKCQEISMTITSPRNNVCSSKCAGSTGCRQECQQANEDFQPRIDPDPTTNCVNKCRDDGNCRGSRKCCRIRCRFRCPQPVPAGPDTFPKKKAPHAIGCRNSTCSGDTECPNHPPCCPPLRRSSRLSVSLSLLGLGCRWCSDPRQLCHLAPERGPCRRRLYRYAYIPALRSCRVFVYSGCGGNVNNFRTAEECRQVCQYGLDKR
ncbi:WAP four-disulfide core domain protein 8-like [Tympanuchus pallidicinctus]|uniref:WAP four-disulfide core domain protein 8-like n=1 Tax=Tympanuchus pallidicinctus TaxID=109042 RepID=UPI0022873560|nr:WAP four-disulfide core domain protein 8-like [Tympanuchus pallidicinctus]